MESLTARKTNCSLPRSIINMQQVSFIWVRQEKENRLSYDNTLGFLTKLPQSVPQTTLTINPSTPPWEDEKTSSFFGNCRTPQVAVLTHSLSRQSKYTALMSADMGFQTYLIYNTLAGDVLASTRLFQAGVIVMHIDNLEHEMIYSQYGLTAAGSLS